MITEYHPYKERVSLEHKVGLNDKTPTDLLGESIRNRIDQLIKDIHVYLIARYCLDGCSKDYADMTRTTFLHYIDAGTRDWSEVKEN